MRNLSISRTICWHSCRCGSRVCRGEPIMTAAEAAGDYCDARCVQVRIPISPGVHIEGVLRLPASGPVASLVVHGATATSSHFYRGFAQDFGAVTADPTRRVRLPRPQQRAGVFPTAAQLKRLTENSRKPTGRW